MDLASSIQAVTELIVLKISRHISKIYKLKNLYLNWCSFELCSKWKNIKNIFDNIWVQPASGDAGGSLGAAQAFYFQELGNFRKISRIDSMKGSYLGPEYSDKEIESELKNVELFTKTQNQTKF